MNEKLIVKNFGPIKNAELDLKKVTVFIGPQGSGKSTLAKLVAICKEEEKPSFLMDKRPISFRVIDYGIESYKNKDTSFRYSSKFYNISYSRTIYKKQPISSIITDVEFEIAQIREKRKQLQNIENSLSFNSEVALQLEYLKILKPHNFTDSIYIPTERFLLPAISASLYGFINNEINLPKTLTEFGNKYANASIGDAKEDIRFRKAGSLKTKYIELFDLHFHQKDGQSFLIDTNNNYEINLKDSASGMQSSIPLILVIRHEYRKGNTHFIVEEPELNLFPTTQKQLVGYLADKCSQNDNELLMTTHSPYILSSLNNLLFAYQVANKYPEMAKEVATIIPREQWINPDDFEAYYVGENENGEKGGIRSIFNKKTGLIGENELDAISEDLGGEFDALMNIYRTKKRETVN